MKRWGCCLLAMLCVWFLLPGALADASRDALFDAALAALLSPAQEGVQTGAYALRTGESAYVPAVSPGVTPYDQETVRPAVAGTFESDAPGVVTVNASGLMTALAPGEATVTYTTASGATACRVTVSDDALPELIKNYIYVLYREFYSVKRATLPKYNQYAKWYYGRRNEVGWCAVFTIYCANAAGANPVKAAELPLDALPNVQFVREGAVGKQYDGYMAMGRFVSVPRPGYLVIYADLSNAYRTVHIGSVTNVQDMGGGLYAVTTVEGNMSNSVKSYCYLYNANKPNHMVGAESGRKLNNNMSELDDALRTDPLVQYELQTDHWAVFGFCQTWE